MQNLNSRNRIFVHLKRKKNNHFGLGIHLLSVSCFSAIYFLDIDIVVITTIIIIFIISLDSQNK